MEASESINYILVVAVVSGLFSLYFLVSFFRQVKKIRPIKSVKKFIGLALFSSMSLSLSFLLIGLQGYKALTEESLIAKVSIIPKAGQNFVAIVQLNNGQEKMFNLSGDQVMFEANVIKWKPWSNILGLKTVYRLDRIKGRYSDIADERSKPRTLYELVEEENINIAEWREQYQYLSLLLDVEHGSASYASTKQMNDFELMITTNGLLLRPVTK